MEAGLPRLGSALGSALALLVLSGGVGLVADHVEVAVELDIDLAAVVEGHLYLVEALLVAGLGLGDGALAGVLERRRLGLVEGRAGDRLLGSLVVVAADGAGRGRDAGATGRQRGDRCSDDYELPALAHVCLHGSGLTVRRSFYAGRVN